MDRGLPIKDVWTLGLDIWLAVACFFVLLFVDQYNIRLIVHLQIPLATCCTLGLKQYLLAPRGRLSSSLSH